MSLLNYYKTTGPASRTQVWVTSIIPMATYTLALISYGASVAPAVTPDTAALSTIAGLVLFVLTIIFGAANLMTVLRRLKILGRPAVLLILFFVPYVNLGLLLYVGLKDANPEHSDTA